MSRFIVEPIFMKHGFTPYQSQQRFPLKIEVLGGDSSQQNSGNNSQGGFPLAPSLAVAILIAAIYFRAKKKKISKSQYIREKIELARNACSRDKSTANSSQLIKQTVDRYKRDNPQHEGSASYINSCIKSGFIVIKSLDGDILAEIPAPSEREEKTQSGTTLKGDDSIVQIKQSAEKLTKTAGTFMESLGQELASKFILLQSKASQARKTSNKIPEKEQEADLDTMQKASKANRTKTADNKLHASPTWMIPTFITLGIIGTTVTIGLLTTKNSSYKSSKQTPQELITTSDPKPLKETSSDNGSRVFLGTSAGGQSVFLDDASIKRLEEEGMRSFTYSLDSETIPAIVDCKTGEWTPEQNRQWTKPRSEATKEMIRLVCKGYTPKPRDTTQGGQRGLVFDPPSNIRVSPNGAILCTVSEKRIINISSTLGNWLGTDFCGRPGYIHKGQVNLERQDYQD